MEFRTLRRLAHLICLSLMPALFWAQNLACEATTLEEFYNCYEGPEDFNAHSVAALTTFIEAEDAIQAGDYAEAKVMVDALFETYPKGNNVWFNAYAEINGSNIGSPHAYYGLRMMEDIIDHHLNNSQDVEARTVKMKVVLVGCSQGIQPTTDAELQNGTGTFVEHVIDPKLRADNYRILRQSFDLMSRYVTAITKGQLVVEVEFVELPEMCLEVGVTSTEPHLAYSGIGPVWDNLDEEVKAETDWWWIIYPSHVPEFPDFEDESFITGGMGGDSKGGPVFIADDQWAVRKPAHLGAGLYSDIERRAYLPQWFQHEFFHHLFRIYPELNLEVNGHDWFNLNFWPADFEGRFETDFYSEALHKRLQVDCVPLASKLITRVGEEQREAFEQLSIDELVGAYSLENVQNEWHIGEIRRVGENYFWRNNANVQWSATPNIVAGRFETGADSPYPGQDFFIDLYETDGNYIPGVVGLKFQGDIYKKRFGLLRESVPMAIALGEYERRPNESTLHTGSIVKEAGLFYWDNDAGDRWSLTANAEDESFGHGNDSPTPDEAFELVIVEDDCGLFVLGFKYLDHYYWREKRDPLNESPALINPVADQELENSFGTHSIDISGVFTDPEGEALSLFATSSESALVSTEVVGGQLILGGGEMGTVFILLTAVDANGGLLTDEFTVEVGTVSTNGNEAFSQSVSVYPNPAKDEFQVIGDASSYDVSIFSADGVLEQDYISANQQSRIDLTGLSSGVYLVKIAHRDSGRITVKKLIKY